MLQQSDGVSALFHVLSGILSHAVPGAGRTSGVWHGVKQVEMQQMTESWELQKVRGH